MVNIKTVSDALRNLVPFVQFKKRERHPWRSVTFSKVAGSRVLNCTHGIKSHKALLVYALIHDAAALILK